MPQTIELVFSVDPASPPEFGTEGNNDQDTAATPVNLDNLRIGQHPVPDVVKRLGVVLGYDLHVSKVLQQGPERTRILLENIQPSKVESKPDKCPYNITDGGEINTKQIKEPQTPHRSEDHTFIKFRTKFTQAPSVIVGLNFLDSSCKTNIRIYGAPREIHDHLFHLGINTWSDTVLYAAGYTWLAIPTYEYPLFQAGTVILSDAKNDLTHQAITFKNPYTSTPKVVVWLLKIDSERKEAKDTYDTRVMAFATDITPKGFKVHINTWGGSLLYPGGVSWFAYPADTPGICSGDLLPKGTVGVVTFDKPFARPPRRILVALNKLDTNKAADCRFRIVYEAVTEKGMGVRVETWNDTKLKEAGVSYIAME